MSPTAVKAKGFFFTAARFFRLLTASRRIRSCTESSPPSRRSRLDKKGRKDMENRMQIFQNEEFGRIRTFVTEDGVPWFVGKDVVDNLGYQNGSRDINRHVE